MQTSTMRNKATIVYLNLPAVAAEARCDMSELSHKVDLVVHVDNMLGNQRRMDIESALESSQGVRWAHFTDGRPHLMVVEYDPDTTSSYEILQQVNRQSVHAELIGPI